MTIAIGYFGTHANYLGESPLWDPARQWLWWIDARTHTLYAADQQERIVAEWRFELPLGAIALGHPLGMSGARLALTAVEQLHRTGGRLALCTMCIGVGQGIALAVERV